MEWDPQSGCDMGTPYHSQEKMDAEPQNRTALPKFMRLCRTTSPPPAIKKTARTRDAAGRHQGDTKHDGRCTKPPPERLNHPPVTGQAQGKRKRRTRKCAVNQNHFTLQLVMIVSIRAPSYRGEGCIMPNQQPKSITKRQYTGSRSTSRTRQRSSRSTNAGSDRPTGPGSFSIGVGSDSRSAESRSCRDCPRRWSAG